MKVYEHLTVPADLKVIHEGSIKHQGTMQKTVHIAMFITVSSLPGNLTLLNKNL